MNIDICVNDSYQMISTASGDVSLVSDSDCILQDLRLEAVSVEGDLWYDLEWGWSLIDFSGLQQDELVTLEIEQRCRQKLSHRDAIDVDSINVAVDWSEDNAAVAISYRLIGDDELRQLNIQIGKTEIEVVDSA